MLAEKGLLKNKTKKRKRNKEFAEEGKLINQLIYKL